MNTLSSYLSVKCQFFLKLNVLQKIRNKENFVNSTVFCKVYRTTVLVLFLLLQINHTVLYI